MKALVGFDILGAGDFVGSAESFATARMSRENAAIIGASFNLPKLKLDSSLSSRLSEPTNMTPEQLSKLDRALTPAEYERVAKWQEGQSDNALAEVRKTPGPRAEMEVTAKGASLKTMNADGFFSRNVPVVNLPFWQVVLGGLGVLAVLIGGASLVVGGKSSKRSYA